jgi:hypothetical protein
VARRYLKKLVAATTTTDQATIKCMMTLKTDIYSLKSRDPLKLKKTSSGTMASKKLLIDTTFDPC